MLLPQKQSGVALVMAIMIVTLAAITATAITVINQRQIIRTSNMILRDQAFHFATGAEAFTIRILNEDGKDNDSDHLDEEWYNEGQSVVLPIDFANIQDSSRFYLEGTLTDLQSRLNINDISSFPEYVDNKIQANTLLALISALEISVDSVGVLNDSLKDWIDNDNEPAASGAEQYYYLGLEQPYQAANTNLLHTSTLRQIRGFEALEKDDLLTLRKELNALPSKTPLNINTASEKVLEALTLNEQTRATIIANRPYKTVDEFLTDSKTQTGINFKGENFVIESEYFLLDVTAVMDKARVRINSIIQRNNTNNNSKVVLRIIGDY